MKKSFICCKVYWTFGEFIPILKLKSLLPHVSVNGRVEGVDRLIDLGIYLDLFLVMVLYEFMFFTA